MSILHIEVDQKFKAAWVKASAHQRKKLMEWVTINLNDAARRELGDQLYHQITGAAENGEAEK